MKIIKGNLLDTELKYIAHGCNDQGVMGSGVAKAIRARWPGCYVQYSADVSALRSWNRRVIGNRSTYYSDDGTVIFNLITQIGYGFDGKKYAGYSYLVESVISVFDDYGIKQLAIPWIGCGLGGLDKKIVREILEEIETSRGVEFWVYEL